MPIKINLPKLHPGQQEVWDSDARFKVVCCGRRWGKTHLGVLSCIVVAINGGRAWWIGPTYPVANIGWDLLKSICGPIPQIQISESQRLITFPSGGSVQVKSGDNPDSLRGQSLHYVVFDEVADIKEEAWKECVRPALADHRGSALFIGTPRGLDNWFYELWSKQDSDSQWKSWQQPTRTNPFIPEEEIEAAKPDLGPLIFSQEFLAEFIVHGGLVFKPEWERYHSMHDFTFQTGYTLDGFVRLEHEDKHYADVHLNEMIRFMTCDLATSTRTSADYTVLGTWGLTKKHKRLVLLDVLRDRMEGPDIVPAMRQTCSKWKCAWVAIEKAGFQLSLVQQARREYLPVRELRPDKDKWSRALLAAARMESEQIWYPESAPWLDDWRNEIRAFDQAKHDDCVDVLSYAADQADKIAVGPQLVSW